MSLSMTGYGQAVLNYGGYKVRFEVKSVNHRYCEVSLRIPKEWTRFEDGLRKEIQQHVKRGRIDVFIQREREEEQAQPVRLNHVAVDAYLQASRELVSRYGMEGQLSISDLLALPDIFTSVEGQEAEQDDTAWSQLLLEGLREACLGLVTMRRREGEYLVRDLQARIARLEGLHAEIAELSPNVVMDYRIKLRQRLAELQDGTFSLDEHRLGMEIALFADRCNIDEELTRLQSHFGQCKGLLSSDEPAGRKLDFLIQEMNREVNTIGSKANHLELVTRVVELKAELEKIREQAANIE